MVDFLKETLGPIISLLIGAVLGMLFLRHRSKSSGTFTSAEKLQKHIDELSKAKEALDEQTQERQKKSEEIKNESTQNIIKLFFDRMSKRK